MSQDQKEQNQTHLYKVISGEVRKLPLDYETENGYWVWDKDHPKGRRYINKNIDNPYAFTTKRIALNAHLSHLHHKIAQANEYLSSAKGRKRRFIKKYMEELYGEEDKRNQG